MKSTIDVKSYTEVVVCDKRTTKDECDNHISNITSITGYDVDGWLMCMDSSISLINRGSATSWTSDKHQLGDMFICPIIPTNMYTNDRELAEESIRKAHGTVCVELLRYLYPNIQKNMNTAIDCLRERWNDTSRELEVFDEKFSTVSELDPGYQDKIAMRNEVVMDMLKLNTILCMVISRSQ